MKLRYLPVAGLAAAGAVAAAQLPADAHTPTISVYCDEVYLDLYAYDTDTLLTVTIDGAVTSVRFTGNLERTFRGDRTWRVQVDNRGRDFDLDRSGVFEDCAPPTTTTALPPYEPPGFPEPTLPARPPVTTPAPPVCLTPGRSALDATDPRCPEVQGAVEEAPVAVPTITNPAFTG